MIPIVLVLGARRDQLPAFDAVRRRGLSVAAVDPDPQAIGLPRADHVAIADLGDVDACLDFAASLPGLAAVLTFAADYPVPMVAAIAERFGLPGLSRDAAEAATDKLVMRRRLAAAGVPVPAWEHVARPEDGPAAAARLESDVVVKPRRSSGSRGVVAVESCAVREVADAVAAATRFDILDGALIEELVDGRELSVEAVRSGGRFQVIARTEKHTTGAPDFVEVGHEQPALLDPCLCAAIDRVVEASLVALGIDDAVSHTELRVGPDGPVVIEVAARAGGGAIAEHLARLSAGVDVADVAVALALGEAVEIAPREVGGAACYVPVPQPGTLIAVSGVDEARHLPGVESIDIDIRPGCRIRRPRDSRDRVARIVAAGHDAGEAMQRARAAGASITFEVTP